MSFDHCDAIAVSTNEKILEKLEKLEPSLYKYCKNELQMHEYKSIFSESDQTYHKNTLTWVKECIRTIAYVVDYAKFCETCKDLKSRNVEDHVTSSIIFGLLLFIKNNYGSLAFTRCDTVLRNNQSFAIWPKNGGELHVNIQGNVVYNPEKPQEPYVEAIGWVETYIEDKNKSVSL